MRNAIKLLAQEHPIVDLIAEVPSSFLQRYGLPANSTVHPTPKLMPIYSEIMTRFPQRSVRAAGSAMNSLRATQVHTCVYPHTDSS